ncbi:type IV secretory system conjugative DNA transfer family protein [Clostridium sp. ZS2-4]|uniref:type IV secretory system conjugative DNA transfer family protein n=1 Tax=Clostridium sp. ZS2-4 TaxID=2987703 RepID=UPI00227C78AF|nr:hypothetical protein [Clostridium sp. ZS2-4]MCY6356614.1 hypothetical protein [Clostridium sp. ZS2-4]
MLIKLGYSMESWKNGVKSPFFLNTNKVPHILLSGITGGGKTVLAQMIVNQLLSENKSISICDFKAGGDWVGIIPNYAEYTDCDKLLDTFYNSFVDTIKQKSKSEQYLIFDEFSSYALSKDNKEFKELMTKISHIAFMGRSFGYKLFFISQQFNSKVLDTAIREQFGIKLYMGSTISTESAAMLFPNCEIDKSIHLPKCCGYISMPEKDIDTIQIPFLSEPEKLKQLLITKGMLYR